MWDYTGKVLDHFRNPRNVGEIENPDGIGEVGSLACGDALKLTFALDEAKERIVDARFKTFGCASAIASSSALTEMIKGMTIAEAAAVTNQDIAEYLGGLPEQKMHCSVMGREALEAAIENYDRGAIGEKRTLDGKVVCTCFGVTDKELRDVIKTNHLTTVEEVTNYTKAGGGCGGCIPDIESLLAEFNAERKDPSGEEPARHMTIVEKLRLVQETLDREVRPLLKKDGGDLDLVDIVANRVIIAFRGACSGCHVAEFTMKDVVEAKLREFVAPDIVVEEEGS